MESAQADSVKNHASDSKTNSKEMDVPTCSVGKNQRGGKHTNGAEEFSIFNEGEDKRTRYMCCEDNMRPIVWNSQRALNYFLSFESFLSGNLLGYENLVGKHHGTEAAEAKKKRRFRESI